LINRSRSSSSREYSRMLPIVRERPHEAEPLVLAQGLRMHAQHVGRHADEDQVCSVVASNCHG
jgi:hypothetical protein